jgi:hypothetical protein
MPLNPERILAIPGKPGLKAQGTGGHDPALTTPNWSSSRQIHSGQQREIQRQIGKWQQHSEWHKFLVLRRLLEIICCRRTADITTV